MDATEERGELRIGERTLAWRRLGGGEPLLLVNGYAASSEDWDPTFLLALAKSFSVLCPDNRGIGRSSLGEPGEVSIDSMAADLEALLDELGIERAVVAGWSMGGFVVQRLAERAPGRVKALALLGTDPGGGEAVICSASVWARLTDHSGSPREQASRLISLLFPSELAVAIDRDFGELVAAARAALDPEALSAQERAMIAWGRTAREPVAADVPRPLIAHGTEDVIIPPQNADRLAEHYGSSRVELFAGGGHAFMAQEPQRLADLIASFSAS